MHKKLNSQDGGEGSAGTDDGPACAKDDPGCTVSDVVFFVCERVSIGIVRRFWVNT